MIFNLNSNLVVRKIRWCIWISLIVVGMVEHSVTFSFTQVGRNIHFVRHQTARPKGILRSGVGSRNRIYLAPQRGGIFVEFTVFQALTVQRNGISIVRYRSAGTVAFGSTALYKDFVPSGTLNKYTEPTPPLKPLEGHFPVLQKEQLSLLRIS